jgi:hypothetical protein
VRLTRRPPGGWPGSVPPASVHIMHIGPNVRTRSVCSRRVRVRVCACVRVRARAVRVRVWMRVYMHVRMRARVRVRSGGIV